MKTSAALRICDLSLNVHLGCTAEEQSSLQEVRVSVTVFFSKLPAAANSDRLDETVCYAAICDLLRHFCLGREFKTIERMGYTLLELLLEHYPQSFKVQVHKVRPPVEGLVGGAIFECQGERE